MSLRNLRYSMNLRIALVRHVYLEISFVVFPLATTLHSFYPDVILSLSHDNSAVSCRVASLSLNVYFRSVSSFLFLLLLLPESLSRSPCFFIVGICSLCPYVLFLLAQLSLDILVFITVYFSFLGVLEG